MFAGRDNQIQQTGLEVMFLINFFWLPRVADVKTQTDF